MSRTVRLLGLGILALLLTGCIKLNVDLNVASDNTVSGSMIFAFSKQLLALTGQSADQLLQSSAPLPTEVPGISSEPYEDDDFAGERFTFESVPLARFNSGDPESLQIERQGDVFKVSGVLDLSSPTGASGASGPSGFGDAVNQAFSSADISITMTFPGAVTQSNGEISGNSVTWKPKIGERQALQATAGAVGSGSSSSTILLIAIAAAAVVIVVIVVVAVARGKRGGPGRPETEAMAGAPAPPTPPMAPMRPMAPIPPEAATTKPPEGGTAMPPAPPAPPEQ
jgi:hypothetical protein